VHSIAAAEASVYASPPATEATVTHSAASEATVRSIAAATEASVPSEGAVLPEIDFRRHISATR
jgi:hypothetical protein